MSDKLEFSAGFRNVTLEKFADGALKERFEEAKEDMIRDIFDPNKEPEAIRTLTIKLKVKPGADRKQAEMWIADCSCPPTPKKVVSKAVHFGKSKGKLYMVEQADQLEIEDTVPESDKIKKINGGKE